MNKVQIIFEAIGTHWVIDIWDNLSTDLDLLKQKIFDRIEIFDKNYSRFRPDSKVSEISKTPGTYQLPSDASYMISLYRDFYDLTDGQMTPLIGRLMEESGYDANYSLKPTKLNSIPSWENAMEYNAPNLITKMPIVLDFGALGKGYLVDIIGRILTENKINNFCIDAGGDILYKTNSDKSLTIGLEHPENKTLVIGAAKILNNSICGSSGNRRNWGKYHHILNPKTLESASNILSTWVISKETILSDGLSTALYFASAKKLQTKFDFEYLILFPDYSIEKSENFPAELYYK